MKITYTLLKSQDIKRETKKKAMKPYHLETASMMTWHLWSHKEAYVWIDTHIDNEWGGCEQEQEIILK